MDPIITRKIDEYLKEKQMGDEFVGDASVIRYTPAFFEQTYTDEELQKVNIDQLNGFDINVPRISSDTLNSIMQAAFGKDESQQQEIMDALASELSHLYVSKYSDHQGGFTISVEEMQNRLIAERASFLKGLFQYMLDYETNKARQISSVSCHLGTYEREGKKQAIMLVLLNSTVSLRKINGFQIYAITADGKRYALDAERIEEFNVNAEYDTIHERKEVVYFDQFEQYKKQTGIEVDAWPWHYSFKYTRFIFSLAYRVRLTPEVADILTPGTRISIRFNGYDIRGSFASDVSENWNLIKYLLGDNSVENSVKEAFDKGFDPDRGEPIDLETAKTLIKKEMKDNGLLPIAGLEQALKMNIEFQKRYSGETAYTNLNSDTGVNVQVVGKSFPSDIAHLVVYLRFFPERETDLPYWKKFKRTDIFNLFKIDDIDLSGDLLKECHVDYGEDYIGATQLITFAVQAIYGLNGSTSFTFETKSDGVFHNEQEKCRQSAIQEPLQNSLQEMAQQKGVDEEMPNGKIPNSMKQIDGLDSLKGAYRRTLSTYRLQRKEPKYRNGYVIAEITADTIIDSGFHNNPNLVNQFMPQRANLSSTGSRVFDSVVGAVAEVEQEKEANKQIDKAEKETTAKLVFYAVDKDTGHFKMDVVFFNRSKNREMKNPSLLIQPTFPESTIEKSTHASGMKNEFEDVMTISFPFDYLYSIRGAEAHFSFDTDDDNDDADSVLLKFTVKYDMIDLICVDYIVRGQYWEKEKVALYYDKLEQKANIFEQTKNVSAAQAADKEILNKYNKRGAGIGCLTSLVLAILAGSFIPDEALGWSIVACIMAFVLVNYFFRKKGKDLTRETSENAKTQDIEIAHWLADLTKEFEDLYKASQKQ